MYCVPLFPRGAQHQTEAVLNIHDYGILALCPLVERWHQGVFFGLAQPVGEGRCPMAKRVQVFYAYPSQPPSLGETIGNAIEHLKTFPEIKRQRLHFKPWADISMAGRRLITEITQGIDRSEVFAYDLTYPNLNVAFEVGYAIGRFKRIWISLDTATEKASREYQRLYGGILSAGYADYLNHRSLAERFIADNPWSSLEDHLLSDSYKVQAPRPERPTLLYLRPPIETDAVIATAETLQSSFFSDGLLIDDPNENPIPPLEWYADKIHTVDAVLVHLLANDHRDSLRHNLKASLVAGLAHGFRKPLRMLAHVPFETPIDYQQLLTTHATAEQCRSVVRQWLSELEPTLPRRRPRRVEERRERPKKLDLRNLTVGEPVAEHESDALDEYFVETSNYYEALESQTAILLGRRGTGKTANLYALERTLAADKRNQVCVIKPPGYEIDSLVRLLQENIHLAERGYLIESLWKFLIYSELACNVANDFSRRPSHQLLTPHETELANHVEARSAVLCAPFSRRLDTAVRSLIGLGSLPDPQKQYVRISELLHVNELHDLRRLLGLVLSGRHKVTVLIDNLDDPWRPGHHIEYQSDLLMGLLRVATDISNEFRRQDYWQRRVNMSLVIFLRSDIFAHIQPLATEQDKLPLHRIVWNDDESLLRVLDQRLARALPTDVDLSDLWRELLPQEVVGLPTREFITLNTLPRPRDVIFLVKQAIAAAVNRGHKAVTPDDFLDARRSYSEFAFRSLLAEDDPNRGKLEAVLYEFAGAPKIMPQNEVQARIARAGVEEPHIDFYLDLLCDVNFLGIQTEHGYRFPAHEGERQLLRAVATTIAANRESGEHSYQINAAFYQVLDID